MWEPTWCDNCATQVREYEQYWIDRLPVGIDSANAGESAVLCRTCRDMVMGAEPECIQKAWVLRQKGCKCCGHGAHTSYIGVEWSEKGLVEALRLAKRWNEQGTSRWKYHVSVARFNVYGHDMRRKREKSCG